MRMVMSTPLVAACAVLAVFGSPAAAQDSLGMAELKALIIGNTVYALNLSNGLFLRAHYEPWGPVCGAAG